MHTQICHIQKATLQTSSPLAQRLMKTFSSIQCSKLLCCKWTLTQMAAFSKQCHWTYLWSNYALSNMIHKKQILNQTSIPLAQRLIGTLWSAKCSKPLCCNCILTQMAIVNNTFQKHNIWAKMPTFFAKTFTTNNINSNHTNCGLLIIFSIEYNHQFLHASTLMVSNHYYPFAKMLATIDVQGKKSWENPGKKSSQPLKTRKRKCSVGIKSGDNV